jgi:Rieske Fe-S protein
MVGGTLAVVVGAVVGIVYGRNSDAYKAGGSTGGGTYGSLASSSGGSSGGSAGTSSGSSSGASSGAASGAPAGKLFAPLSAVPDGGGLIKGGAVVTRTGSSVHAFSSTCTHLGCTVNKVSGGKIYCPCHGSVFDATTGKVVSPPAPSPLPPISATVRNGDIYLS